LAVDSQAAAYLERNSRETPQWTQKRIAKNGFSAPPSVRWVAQTRPPGVNQMSRVELQALGKRLREARDRSRRIASQQQREMRGKADPRGAAPARDNTGSLSKTAVLVSALKRVTAALRKLNKPAST
jgi:hypothetical protein